MAQSVGEQLKQTRLARGLTLDQAAQGTRIRKHYIEALERDDKDSLPSPVQGRGFLRLYAGYLGLPGERLAAQWEGKPFEEPAPAQTAPAAAPEPQEPSPQEAVAAESAPPQPVEEPEEPEEEPEYEVPAGSSREVFKDIGVDLRKQRETLSLSIPDVERYTRLRQHYLRAMEAGRLDDLPSLVQGRGMLSNYATFLNLDGEEILLRYAEGLQRRRLERLEATGTGRSTAPRARQANGVRRLLTPDLIIGGGLILALFAFVLWTAARVNTIEQAESQATLPSVGEVLLETPSVTSDPSQPSTAAIAGSPESTIEGEPPASGNVSPETENGTSAQTPAVPIEQPSAAPTVAPINSDPLQVYVIARERAFLRVICDGEIKFNGRVAPGNAYPFSGRESVELISGDAAAFQVFFNQAELGTLGGQGDVLRMLFSQTGVTTPTAAPTATPAATATPDLTVTATPGPSPTVITPTVTPLIP